MSKKNPPADSGFGELEDDFFSSGAVGWGEPDDGAAQRAAAEAEEARLASEARQAEEARLAEEARKAEEARAAEEARSAEEARAAEEARQAEEARAAEEARLAEEARRAEEARAAEEAQKAEEARAQAARPASDGLDEGSWFSEGGDGAAQGEAARAAAEAAEAERSQAEAAEATQLAADEEARLAAARAALSAQRGGVAANPTLVLNRAELLAQFAADATEDMPITEAAALAETPAVEPETPEAPVVPAASVTADGSWASAVATLQREAAQAEGPTRVALLIAAAQVARTRAGAPQDARALLDAIGVGGRRPVEVGETYWRERVATLVALGDAEGLAAALDGLAGSLEGGAASDTLLAAAAVSRGRLRRDDLAIAELERAASTRDDVRALLAMLDIHRSRGDFASQAAMLGRLAARYQGEVAGALLAERAQVLSRGGASSEELLAAWRAAYDADPGNTAAFLALERMYRQAAHWSALAALYLGEADRTVGDARIPDTARGAEAAWWYARAARVYRLQLFDEARAADAYGSALQALPAAADLRHEYGVFCAEAERWEDLAASLEAEIAWAPEGRRSLVQYRLARVLEDRLGRREEALALYRAATVDPAAAPAAEAVLRILQQEGRWAELVSFLEERLERLDDPSLTVTVLYRMGETCEGPLDDQAGARKHYERILDVAPGYLPALEGLERVYTRLGAWADLAAVYDQRALLAEDPQGVALQRHRAGAVYDFRLADLDRATEQYRLALEAVPDFSASLDAYVRVLEGRGEWDAIGKALRAAATGTRDANEAVSLYYRAGRVLADRTDDVTSATVCLRRCLDLSPGFLPAVLLLKELTSRQGDWAEYFRLERGQADMGGDLDRRHWRLLAAAEAAGAAADTNPGAVAAEVLREDAGQVGALDLAERVALANGDTSGLVDLYLRRAAVASDDAERVRFCARVAELAADQGAGESLARGLSEVLGATGVETRPLRALARVAESAGYVEEALRALAETGAEGRDGARLRRDALGDAAGATRILGELVEGRDPAAAAAVIRATVEPAVRGRAHLLLAGSAADPAASAEHALLAAPLLEEAGLADEALAAWRSAFEADPRPGHAADGLRRNLVVRNDAEGLRALYGALAAEHAAGLGDALEEIGDLSGAVEAWKAELGRAPERLPWSLRLEHALGELGEWKQVFELLQARAAEASAETRAEITARSRWLLAEKLAETEEAWDFYRQLHESAPNDVEVLEALARIAGVRGETPLSIQYLEGLAARAGSPRDAARYQRRMAEAFEHAGDAEGARAALTRALDVLPDDHEALASLRRLAEASEDWQGVVGVLARQAALSSGRVQVDRFAEIARLWEDKLGDRAVAADAWRKVLDLAPDDEEALRGLVALTEEGGDWAGFVEYGQALLRVVEGAERSTLQRRVGMALAEHLRREDEAVRLLDAASSGTSPDVIAARALERIHLGRGEWDRVVEAMRRRARASTDDAERVEALAGAARIRAESLRDRNGAAEIYEELLRVAPEHPEALRFSAEVLYESARFDEVVSLFERMEPQEAARDLDDFDAQVEVASFFFRFAEALRRTGRAEEAIARYERALALNATHLPSLEAVGPMYMQTGDWQKADKVWKQLLQLTGGQGNPEQLARIYANLGAVEHHLGQSDKARKRFTKALELRPNDIFALRGYGSVLFAAEDWNSLLNIYNNIIYHTQDPADVVDAYLSKGFVLDARLNLPEKAAQHYEKSLAFDPAQPQALLRLAEIALRRQDWPEAASLAERGLQIQSAMPTLRAYLLLIRSIAYQACGDARAAGDGYKAALAVDPAVGEALGGASIEDYERVHEILRSRLQSAQHI